MPSQQPMRDKRFPRHPSDILPAPEEDELKFLSPDQEVAVIAVVGKAERPTAGSIDRAIPSGRSGASQRHIAAIVKKLRRIMLPSSDENRMAITSRGSIRQSAHPKFPTLLGGGLGLSCSASSPTAVANDCRHASEPSPRESC